MNEENERLDEALARLDPDARIAELEREVEVLRAQRDQLIRATGAEEAARGFAWELLCRGIRPRDFER